MALFANTAVNTTTNNSWKITGNSNIDPTTQFIGTTDDNALQFKVNNEKAGIIETNDNTNNTIKNANTAFGYQSLNSNTTGYDNVANMAGGIVDWERDGLPINTDVNYRLSGSCMCQLKAREKSKNKP